MSNTLDKLYTEHYTTEQVAQAVGRTAEHWCRIRHRYIAKYGLQVVKVGRRYYYKRQPVNSMIDQLVEEGE
jgi:hypothetical protein